VRFLNDFAFSQVLNEKEEEERKKIDDGINPIN
jgi:hypothetical protein